MKDLISRHGVSAWLDNMGYPRLAYTVMDEDRFPPAQRWIPCSERLPEKNCRCLTTNTALGAFEVDFNVWINGEWLYPNKKPIAWMPLPEPYKGGKHETD